ncbi:MAG TPA: Hsp20/alpha crystallin family protein [Chthonomonadales bacterium]|nr:Hsp20/alpha crystallin family protein [Chthonomonadales bacterium]
MGSKDFNPLDIFLQLESDIRRSAAGVMNAVSFQPHADVYDTRAAVLVRVELAGVDASRLTITLSEDDRTLLIRGEREEPKEGRQERIGCYQLEIFYGAFERQILLPANLRIDRDAITATYRDGLLEVTMPRKTRSAPEKRTIEITSD